MPEICEIIILCNQLKREILNADYKNNKVLHIHHIDKTIYIEMDNEKFIKINLMLTGHLSVNKSSVTRHTLHFIKDNKEIPIYINDKMNLASVIIVSNILYYDKISLHDYASKYPNTLIYMALKNLKIGIGNYLVSEITNKCNINPLTKCKELGTYDINLIVRTTNKLISSIIKLGGSIYYNDLYDVPGRYNPIYYKNPNIKRIKKNNQYIYIK